MAMVRINIREEVLALVKAILKQERLAHAGVPVIFLAQESFSTYQLVWDYASEEHEPGDIVSLDYGSEPFWKECIVMAVLCDGYIKLHMDLIGE